MVSVDLGVWIGILANVAVMAYGFYHLASMLLMIYKPFPRFAIRKVQRELKETDASDSTTYSENFAHQSTRHK
jgi:hypothetical protein